MICIYLGTVIVAIIVASILAQLRLRRGRAEAVVQTLAGAMAQELPLPAALRAAAVGERRAMRRAFTRLADDLERGDALPDALARSAPGCPAEALGAVRAAGAAGTLAAVLASYTARKQRSASDPLGRNVSGWYTATLLILVPLMLVYIMTMIIPKYQRIFADFDTKLPIITRTLVDAAFELEGWAPIIAGLIVLVAVAIVFRRLVRRRSDRLQVSFALFDTVAWHLPVARQLANATALSEQLPLMQASIRAGQDLADAADHATLAAANFHACRRLRRWSARLRRGDDARASARELGFPSPLLRALGNARGTRDLADGFEYLAEYYRSLNEHWRRLATEFVTPFIVGAWALVVGYIVVGLFLPLVTLIQSMTSALG